MQVSQSTRKCAKEALVALKPPGENSLPKYVLRSIPNPSVNNAEGNSIPNISVNKAVGNQSPNYSVNSGIQNAANSTQDPKVKNKAQVQTVQNNAVNANQETKGNEIPIVNSVPISSNVPKLEIRKEIKEKSNEPSNPNGNGDNNKTIPNVSAPRSLMYYVKSTPVYNLKHITITTLKHDCIL